MYVLKKEGLDEAKINQALERLLVDRKNEFRELSNMVLPKTQSEPIKNWEQFVMNFCLDVNEAFKTFWRYGIKFKIYTKSIDYSKTTIKR